MSLKITISSINYDGELATILFKPDNDIVTINLGEVTLPFDFEPSLLIPPREVYGTYTILVEDADCPNILNVYRPTPTVTPTPTNTKTPTPTNTKTQTSTPTFNPCLVTKTPTVTPTNTKTPTPTKTPTKTIDPCLLTKTHTPTNTQTPTNTETPTQTPTQTPTNTTTPTITSTPTQTSAPECDILLTIIPITPTPTVTQTPTKTPSPQCDFTLQINFPVETPTPTVTNTPTNTPTTPSPFLLDNYPNSVAAFSARKLSSTYSGPCMRVRRNFDNTELDIGFTTINGKVVLDSPALMDFVTGPYGSWSFTGGLYQGVNGTGYVVVWYDQSGNDNHAYQYTPNQQQGVVINGTRTALLDKDGNYQITPYLHSFFESMAKAPLSLTTNIQITAAFTLGQVFSQNNINYIFFGSSGSIGGAWYNGSFVDAQGLGFFDGVLAFSLTGEDLLSHLGYFDFSTGRMLISKDGAPSQDLGASLTPINLTHIAGRTGSSALYFRGGVNEFVFYNTDQSVNKVGIETNINNFYNTY